MLHGIPSNVLNTFSLSYSYSPWKNQSWKWCFEVKDVSWFSFEGICNVRVFQPESVVPEHLRFASKGPGFHVAAAPKAVATNVAESPNVPAPFKQSIQTEACDAVALRLWEAYFNKNIQKTKNHHQGEFQYSQKWWFSFAMRLCRFCWICWIFECGSQLFLLKNSHSNKRQAEQWLPLKAPGVVVTSRTSRRSASTTFAPRSWEIWRT